jgi:type IV fimbrial biogenesis protein FimT
MRPLTSARMRACSRGLTLIEIMVALVISALVLTFAAPHMGDYFTNTRMREGLHSVMAQALLAQSEALKRNTPVRLAVTTNAATVTVIASGNVIATQTLLPGLESTTGTIDFGANGLPTPLGASLQLVVSQTGVTCSADMRCPRLNVDGGGGVRVCGDSTGSCP